MAKPTNSDIGKWRSEYEKSRYLRKVSNQTLIKRRSELIANLWSTDKNGNPIQARNLENRHSLVKLIMHVLLENAEREGRSSIEFDELKLRSESTAMYLAPKVKPALGSDRGTYAKYGNRTHIFDAYKFGKLRIGPAASYTDPSLNDAQRDDELLHWTITPDEHVEFRLGGVDGQIVPHESIEMFRGKTIDNFYVWCCAWGYDARLFSDFKYDAAIIIRNGREFERRLTAAMSKILPDSICDHRQMEYYDPYTTPHENIKLPFMKKIKFLYQNEYRFVWHTQADLVNKPIFLELGSLEDIADFHELE